MLLALLLAACAGGPDIDRLAADKTLITGSIEPAAGTPAAEGQPSDEAAIRNAVGSADLSRLPEDGLAWANPATGAHGTIGMIMEESEKGQLCRRFTATRVRYDGVNMYSGHICLGPAGWSMMDFTIAHGSGAATGISS